jgi:hydrogenase large subunit
MARIITINPVTRISGFLEINIEVDNNTIIDAKSGGMLFRGFEKILRGRSPLDAIYLTQRICGICSTAHSMASTLALEDVLGVKPNRNDKLLRDFVHGCEILQNHLRHFYQFTLPDYVRGLETAPLDTSYHHDYRIPEGINSELASHYSESCVWGRLAHQMLAVLGGKAPHNHGVFVGGITVALNSSDFIMLKSILQQIKEFVKSKMIPDVFTIAKFYSDYFLIGNGNKSMLSYGLFDDYEESELFYIAPQVMINGERRTLDSTKITENIQHSWYESSKPNHLPTDSTIEENVHKVDAYSFIKAPRYDGHAMEVGPLARMLLSGNYVGGNSTMDRTIARVLETDKIITIMEGMLHRVSIQSTNQKQYEIPAQTTGKGLTDTARGALGHWISIKDHEILNYEIITPSAWNLSSTDSEGIKGPVEHCLLNINLINTKNPVEVGRVVRSFDPCISCATHVFSDQFEPIQVRIV